MIDLRLRVAAGLAASLLACAAHAQTVLPSIPVGASPTAIAINPVTNKVYVTNDGSNSVSVISGATHSVIATIPANGRPTFVSANPEANRIYVSNITSGTVMAIDGATDTVSTMMMSGVSGWIATNPLTDKAYVLRYGAGDEVNIIQGEAYLLTSATRAYEPVALAVNPVHNMVYIVHRATGDLVALDMTLDESYPPRVCPDGAGGIRPFDPHEEFPPNCINIPDVPVAVAVNPVTSKVYAISSVATDQISVVNGPTMANPHTFVTLTPPGVSGDGRAVAVNPLTNKVYFAFARHVVVLDGATNAMTVIPAGSEAGGPVAVGINVLTNRIYVPGADGTLKIIDGDDNSSIDVAIPVGARAIAINPLTNVAYVLGDVVTPVQGPAESAAHPNLLTATITDSSGTLSTGNGSIRIDVSNTYSPAPLDATRKVYYQVDGAGPWLLASGSGPWTATIAGLGTGPHTIRAFATNGLDSQSINTHPQDNPIVGNVAALAFTVAGSPSSVELRASANPSIVGHPVTFTATARGGGATPTGTFEFRDDGTPIAGCTSIPITGGSSGCTTSALALGLNSVTAHYSGSGTYQPSESAPLAHRVLQTVDKRRTSFDGNGRTDMAWRNANGSFSLWTMDGLAFSIAPASAGPGMELVRLADFNGDGNTDLLWRGTNGSYRVQLLQGTAVTADATILAGGTGWEVIDKGDFNGDGRHDLVWKHSNGALGLWLMNGTSYFVAGGIANPGAGWTPALVADFDGDSRSDVLYRHADGRAAVYLMDGQSSTANATLLGAGTGWAPVFATDLDGDGKADLLWRHTDGSLGAWLMNGAAIGQYTTLLEAGSWSATLAADFDGDGKSDLAFAHPNGQEGGWLMDGLAMRSFTAFVGAGDPWSIIGAGDYDGDGKADLLWRHANGTHGAWLMDGLAAKAYGALGAGGATPIP